MSQPTAPNTWLVLEALQLRMQQELLIVLPGNNPPAVSPFDAWSHQVMSGDNLSDYDRYGASNSIAPVANAIYIGHPKDPRTKYSNWAEVTAIDEKVYRQAFGGKVWHETPVYFRCVFKYVANWFTTEKTAILVADQTHYILGQHAELPNAPLVEATKELDKYGNFPTGFFFDAEWGRDYLCFATVIWTKQQWFVQGGIVP